MTPPLLWMPGSYFWDNNQRGVKRGCVHKRACRQEGEREGEREVGEKRGGWVAGLVQLLMPGSASETETDWGVEGGTRGAVSTCGPRAEEKRFTYAHSWTDEETSGTTLQSWVRPLILHTLMHAGMYILSSVVAVFFTNRAQKHLKRNSARLQIFRVDDYPPWQVSLLALRYLQQRKEDEEERLCVCLRVCVVMLYHLHPVITLLYSTRGIS